jgi:hypothetical protein
VKEQLIWQKMKTVKYGTVGHCLQAVGLCSRMSKKKLKMARLGLLQSHLKGISCNSNVDDCNNVVVVAAIVIAVVVVVVVVVVVS